MLKHKHIDKVCLAAAVLALALTLLFMNGEALGVKPAYGSPGYETRLFDKSRVHTVDIILDDWAGFLDAAPGEQYVPSTLIIDGEPFRDVGLRVKGNNSRRLTEEYGLDRFSLKAEFDQYNSGSYYGLDKFSLDASFQDNSYLKSFLAYDMMDYMGVPTPLNSYVWVTVNGDPWGLFLAIEEPEEAFAQRNYGRDYGKLYKPDYKSLEDENADVALKYIDENPDSYDNIFRNAKFDISDADKQRVIDALRVLSTGANLETAVNVDSALRYFVVQTFVVNLDSYLGKTGHNYFLYEKDGILQILPWDYNLAYATYSLGMPEPINDSQLYVNFPIDTPESGTVMLNRPLYHNLMLHDEYFERYHDYYDQFISAYFESGYFQERVDGVTAMISPYVKEDPTAFCSYEDYLVGVETITNFCLLRSQSIRGQLEGIIPSTSRGQEQDKSNFVDASSVWLPDMGEIADLKD